ncbi:hypothetical protein DFJ74DRAFT_758282 [Hyaloraphidium curvatum]|nr:hypothetical protein DFJ74DRAFT_758282 [Hyaloraphidium curvatum]
MDPQNGPEGPEVADDPLLEDNWRPGPRYAADARRHCVFCGGSPPEPSAASAPSLASAYDPPPAPFPPPSLPENYAYSDDVTLIVVTSAVRSHPSTSLLDAVLHSACRAEPTLARCRKIIVADHPRTILEDDRTCEWKSGRFTRTAADRYSDYLDRVQVLCDAGEHPYHRAELLRLPSFRGFALALKAGLLACRTPTVAVFQHDRLLLRPCNMDGILRLLRAGEGTVNYVGLASNSTMDALDEKLQMSRYGLKVSVHGRGEFSFEGARYVPLGFWYDSVHAASVSYYLGTVFRPRYEGRAAVLRFRLGDFVEDKFGQMLRADVKANGWAAAAKYGCFMAVPADAREAVVQHVNGRDLGSTRARRLGHFVDGLGWGEEIGEGEGGGEGAAVGADGEAKATADADRDAQHVDTEGHGG